LRWIFEVCPNSGQTSPASGEQRLLGDDQIDQGEQDLELRGVLLQALVAHLAVTEQVLEDVKGMLDSGTNLGPEVLDGLGQVLQRPFLLAGDGAALGGDVPLDLAVLEFLALLGANVASIGEHLLLLAVEQVGRLGNVGNVGRGGSNGVHQPGVGVGPDVRLGPEVVLLALAGLVHLGVARLVFVLGRGRGGNDGRVHQGALLQQQPTAAQQVLDGSRRSAR
jgi:hypothetical protein